MPKQALGRFSALPCKIFLVYVCQSKNSQAPSLLAKTPNEVLLQKSRWILRLFMLLSSNCLPWGMSETWAVPNLAPKPKAVLSDQTFHNKSAFEKKWLDLQTLAVIYRDEFDQIIANPGFGLYLDEIEVYLNLMAVRELQHAWVQDNAAQPPEWEEAELNSRRDEVLQSHTLLAEVAKMREILRPQFVQKKAKMTSMRIQPTIGPEGNLTGNEFLAGTWALTYDDGPHESITRQIVQLLKPYKIPATFFWLASNARRGRETVALTLAHGHSAQNHSFTHANLNRISALSLGFEISVSTETLAQVYGYRPKFFRCPFGAGVHSQRVRSLIAKNGMIHVFWNVDSLDWADKNSKRVVGRVLKQMQANRGGIVLFHDIQAHTAHITKMLISATAPLKLNWMTLDTVVEQLNVRHEARLRRQSVN